jgi:hypothetical protein
VSDKVKNSQISQNFLYVKEAAAGGHFKASKTATTKEKHQPTGRTQFTPKISTTTRK